MLNSRYIHLHQALGLGSMWLNQQARIRPPEGSLKARPLPTLNFVVTRGFQAAHASKRKP